MIKFHMIKLESISKTFNVNKNSFSVLNKINLEVLKSEIFGLIGDSGSGKTTLLRIMTGFILPDKNGVIKRNFHHLESSMIFQNFNLLGNLSVFENAALPLKLRNYSQKEIDKRINYLLNYVGIERIKNFYPHQISGGQKQKTSIIRSLSINPKIIFCDEPTSALDSSSSYEILKLIKEINERFKTTIVLVSHDNIVIKSLCNKVAFLKEGKLIKIKKINPKLDFSFFSVSDLS